MSEEVWRRKESIKEVQEDGGCRGTSGVVKGRRRAGTGEVVWRRRRR